MADLVFWGFLIAVFIMLAVFAVLAMRLTSGNGDDDV